MQAKAIADDSSALVADAPGADAAAWMDDVEPQEDAAESRAFVVEAGQHGQRLDKLLTSIAPEFSRTHLQSLIAAGHVTLGDRPASTPSLRAKAGQRGTVELVRPAHQRAFMPQPLPLQVVFEDAHILVVDKPAGLVVHPAAGNWSGTLLNGLLARDPRAAALPRAGIVHRLDKDTSGLMVVARTPEAVTQLVRAIAARHVHRRYRALVHGALAPGERAIEAPVGRDPRVRVRMAVVASGKPARTDVRTLATRDGITAVQCVLHSGRTHQIRVHLSHAGHPLVADELYGGDRALGMQRQALHAVHLAFAHPVTGAALAFTAAPPADFAAAWACVADPAGLFA